MPTPSVINPTMSRHCLRFFGKVGMGACICWSFLSESLFVLGQNSKRDCKVEVQEDGQCRSEYALMTLYGIWSHEAMD